MSIDGYEDVPPNNEKALKKAVAHQPVSVAIEASGRALQLYESVSLLIHLVNSLIGLDKMLGIDYYIDCLI